MESPFTFIPNMPAFFTVSIMSALCMSRLDGIHPLFKHVPPSLPFSMIATLKPCSAAALAMSNPEAPSNNYKVQFLQLGLLVVSFVASIKINSIFLPFFCKKWDESASMWGLFGWCSPFLYEQNY
jgi:hypothetical protein